MIDKHCIDGSGTGGRHASRPGGFGGRAACLALWLCACLGSAQAAVFHAQWDPPFGAPFADLGWRGTASFFVPDSCTPAGTAVVSNLVVCSGGALVQDAQVELYDITAPGHPTLAALDFDPNSMIISTLDFVAGELSGLATSLSALVDPAEDLAPFGVGSSIRFGLYFTHDHGPRLSWWDCVDWDPALRHQCDSGTNNALDHPVDFGITREQRPVASPGTASLLVPALLTLATAMTLRRRTARRASR